MPVFLVYIEPLHIFDISIVTLPDFTDLSIWGKPVVCLVDLTAVEMRKERLMFL